MNGDESDTTATRAARKFAAAQRPISLCWKANRIRRNNAEIHALVGSRRMQASCIGADGARLGGRPLRARRFFLRGIGRSASRYCAIGASIKRCSSPARALSNSSACLFVAADS